MFGGQKANFVF